MSISTSCDSRRFQTCDEGRHSPANQVVEPHGSIVDVSHFADHAVDVQPLQEEPGESAEVEEVQQDGDDRAHKLQRGRTVTKVKAQRETPSVRGDGWRTKWLPGCRPG